MKLILINGAPGVGKTTLAKKISDAIPLSFLLDLDEQRRCISHYEEYLQESRVLSFDIALAIAEACLKRGQSFVSGKGMYLDIIEGGRKKHVLDMFRDIGEKYQAEIYEILLWADKETMLGRVNDRGFEAKTRLTLEKAGDYWEQTQKFMKKRSQAIVVDISSLSPDEVFKKVSKIVGIVAIK